MSKFILGPLMSFTQLFFTSIMHSETAPEISHELCRKSIGMCAQIGVTGRVFANDQEALAILEGPSDITKMYFHAVQKDPLVDTVILHSSRNIQQREFKDYSIWLNSRVPLEYGPNFHRLNAQTLPDALPDMPSSKIRVMVAAFVTPTLKQIA